MWCKKKRRKKRRRRARRTWILERGCEQSYWLRRRNMNLKVFLSLLSFFFFFLFFHRPFPLLLFSLSLISSPPNTAPKKPAREAKDDDDSDDDNDDSDDEAPTGSDGKPKKEVDEIYRRKESKLFFKKQSANFAQKRNTGKLSEKSVSPPLLSLPSCLSSCPSLFSPPLLPSHIAQQLAVQLDKFKKNLKTEPQGEDDDWKNHSLVFEKEVNRVVCLPLPISLLQLSSRPPALSSLFPSSSHSPTPSPPSPLPPLSLSSHSLSSLLLLITSSRIHLQRRWTMGTPCMIP